jgi:hypothetical protein
VAHVGGRTQGGGQLGFQHPLDHPLGQLLHQAVLPKDVSRVGRVFEAFISQGFLFGMHTGYLPLLLVVMDNNQLHT